MKKFVGLLLVLNLIHLGVKAVPQDIQNATPISVDLVNLSGVNFGSNDHQGNEGKLGGYRPLYPPYFPREPLQTSHTTINSQVTPAYNDNENYNNRFSQSKSLDLGQDDQQISNVILPPKQSFELPQTQQQQQQQFLTSTVPLSSEQQTFEFPLLEKSLDSKGQQQQQQQQPQQQQFSINPEVNLASTSQQMFLPILPAFNSQQFGRNVPIIYQFKTQFSKSNSYQVKSSYSYSSSSSSVKFPNS